MEVRTAPASKKRSLRGRFRATSDGDVTWFRLGTSNRHWRRDVRPRQQRAPHDPYPALFQNPPLLDPEFDTDKTLPLVRYRILIAGEEDTVGEFHCDHTVALGTARTMINHGRYGRLGQFLAEVEVYDADGNLLGRDKHVRTRVNGQKTVQWESIAGRGARADQTEARVRAG